MGPYSDFCTGIVNCRIANNLPGADFATVDREVQAFTCERLGNDPRFCGIPGQMSPPRITAASVYVGGGGGCGGCGGKKA